MSRQEVVVRGLAMGTKAKMVIPITVNNTEVRVAFVTRDVVAIVGDEKLSLKMDVPIGGSVDLRVEKQTIRLHFPQRDKIVIEGSRTKVLIGKRIALPKPVAST